MRLHKRKEKKRRLVQLKYLLFCFYFTFILAKAIHRAEFTFGVVVAHRAIQSRFLVAQLYFKSPLATWRPPNFNPEWLFNFVPERIEVFVECTTPASNRWEDRFCKNTTATWWRGIKICPMQETTQRLRQLYITVHRHLKVDWSFKYLHVDVSEHSAKSLIFSRSCLGGLMYSNSAFSRHHYRPGWPLFGC